MAATTAGASLLAPRAVLGDAGHVHPQQRLDIGDQFARRVRDEDESLLGADRRHDVADARVEAAGLAVDALQEVDPFGKRSADLAARHRVEIMARPSRGAQIDAALDAVGGRDGAGMPRGDLKPLDAHLVGVGVAGLFTGEHADPGTLHDGVIGLLHESFVERHRVARAELEEDVGEVGAPGERGPQSGLQGAGVESEAVEEEALRDGRGRPRLGRIERCVQGTSGDRPTGRSHCESDDGRVPAPQWTAGALRTSWASAWRTTSRSGSRGASSQKRSRSAIAACGQPRCW